MKDTEFKNYFRHTYRNSTSSFLSGYMLMLFDLVGLFLCIGFSFFVVNLANNSMLNFRSFVYYTAAFPGMIAIYFVADLYPGIMISPPEEARRMAICNAGSFAVICCVVALQDRVDFFDFAHLFVRDSSRRGVIFSFMLATPVTIIGMMITRDVGRHFFGHFDWWGVPAVIYATGDSGKLVVNRLQKRKYLGYKPVVIINSATSKPWCASNVASYFDDVPIFAPTVAIEKAIRRLNIKVAIICDYDGDIEEIMNSYRYTIFVSKDARLSTSMQVRDLGGILGFSITHNLTWKSNLFIKRLVDIFLIIVSLPITVPVMAIIAMLVKLTSKGNVFYAHKRSGRNGKPLYCLKFRSMYSNSAEMLKEILATDPERRAQWEAERKFIDDPRITPFGRILRKTSLDELPQLFNILKGEMSFVGPRPVTEEELLMYGKAAKFVFSVTPGLSGMWQISGRSDTGYEERINLDSYYIQNWSIWLDLWIIIKTVGVVLNTKGAY